jgi:hypothetical protein
VNSPNLYIQNIYRGSLSLTVRVCNNGNASAGGSSVRVEHFWSPWVWSNQSVHPDLYTPRFSAGQCTSVLVDWPALGLKA